MKTVLGVVMILSALALAIAPVFTDCESTGKMLTTADGRNVSMKCHWTGVAEIAAAVPLGIAGVYTLFGRRKETLRFAAIVGAASGLMAILLPTVLIGTCMNAAMTCNVLMKPILLASGILAIAASVALFFVAREPELPAAQAAT
jgi:MFS family permease